METMVHSRNTIKTLKVLLISSVFSIFLSGCSSDKEKEKHNDKVPDEKIEFGAGDDFSGPWKDKDETK